MVQLKRYSELLARVQDKSATVLVVGLGYIGLPTALIISENGYTVLGIDTDESLVAELRRGTIRAKEKGLEQLAERHLSRINIHTQYSVLDNVDVCVLCLPSPIDENRRPVLTYLENSISHLARQLTNGGLFLIESTIPVGATELLAKRFEKLSGLRLDENFWFAHCPERVLPGNILKEMDSIHRLVGGVSSDSTDLAVAFLRSLFRENLIHPTSSRISETAKLAENSFRDVNIAFANELAALCSSLSVDVFKIVELANLHPRVAILNPGIGVGGYCLPKDGWILVDSANNRGSRADLIPVARMVNDRMPSLILGCIREAISTGSSEKPRIGLLGLAFKANTSDTRNSPALEIHRQCLAIGIEVITYDPLVSQETVSMMAQSIDDVLESCEMVVLCVGHDIIVEELHTKELSEKVLLDPTNTVPSLRDHVKIYIGLSL